MHCIITALSLLTLSSRESFLFPCSYTHSISYNKCHWQTRKRLLQFLVFILQQHLTLSLTWTTDIRKEKRSRKDSLLCLQTASHASSAIPSWVSSHLLLSLSHYLALPQALNHRDHILEVALDCGCRHAHIQPLPSPTLLCLKPMLKKRQEQPLSGHPRQNRWFLYNK